MGRAVSRHSGQPAELEQLERLVSAQAAALRAVPRSEPVPRSVLALLATPAPRLGSLALAPRELLRLAAVLDKLWAIAGDLSQRQHELGGRIATVRAARRAGPAPNLVDRSG